MHVSFPLSSSPSLCPRSVEAAGTAPEQRAPWPPPAVDKEQTWVSAPFPRAPRPVALRAQPPLLRSRVSSGPPAVAFPRPDVMPRAPLKFFVGHLFFCPLAVIRWLVRGEGGWAWMVGGCRWGQLAPFLQGRPLGISPARKDPPSEGQYELLLCPFHRVCAQGPPHRAALPLGTHREASICTTAFTLPLQTRGARDPAWADPALTEPRASRTARGLHLLWPQEDPLGSAIVFSFFSLPLPNVFTA